MCVIADLSAVGLSKYYYMIWCTTTTTTPLYSDPHRRSTPVLPPFPIPAPFPSSFFNELLVISNLCAVLFLFCSFYCLGSFFYRASICVSAFRSQRLGLGVSSGPGPFLSFAQWRRRRPRRQKKRVFVPLGAYLP